MKLLATLTTVLLLALPGLASAHTGLSASQPADGEVLHESPEKIELIFASEVRLINLVIAADNDQPVELGDYRSPDAASALSVTLPTLTPGIYSAKWTVMGGDAHKMSGSFSFTVSGHGAE